MSPVLESSLRGQGQPDRAFGAPDCQARRRGLTAKMQVALFILVVASALLVGAPSVALAGPVTPSDGIRSPKVTQTVAWEGFAPADWIKARPFTSSVTAVSDAELEPLADAYQVSADGGATWSEWSNVGLTISIPVSTTHLLTVDGLTLSDSASRNFIRFRVTDMGGVESVSPAYLLRVDATAPATPQNLTANPAGWTNTGSFTVSWTNPPDVAGIAGAWYKLNAPPTSPSDGAFVTTTNSITGITPQGDGEHVVYVWLQDALGRAEPTNAASVSLFWDTTPPDPPSFMTGSPARRWMNVNDFAESWRNPSDPSGIAGAYYKLNSLPTSSTDGTFVVTGNAISHIHVPADGRHDIYVWLVDGAGNVEAGALTGDPDVFWYDGTEPVGTMTVTPTLPATGWYTSSVAIGLAATDLPLDPAYPPSMYYQLDGGPWTLANGILTLNSEGRHKLDYQARDKATNVEATKSFAFGIDKTPPVVTLQPDRAANATGWYTAAVTYTLSVVDPVSGGPQGFYRLNDGPWQTGAPGAPMTFSLAAEGSYRIESYGQDAARNRSTQVAVEAHVDGTAPVTSAAFEDAQGENGWYVGDVTVRLTVQDRGSGAAATRYRINGGAWQSGTQVTLSADGIYDLAYYSTDAAGNTEAAQTSQIKIDRAAPAAPTGLTSAPSGWSRTNAFTVQWTSPSDLSGVTGAYYKLGDLSGGGAPTGPKDGVIVTQTQRIEGLTLPGEGAYRLYLWLRDAAGNADQKTTPAPGPVLRFDATPPVTTAQVQQGTPGQNGWWTSPVSVTLTATDGASGVARLHYRVDGGAWQSTSKATATLSLTTPEKHVIEYYAEDVAGSFEAAQQYTVRLDFTAPPAPAAVRVLPAGWTRYNSFHIEWDTVTDLSNIGGAYVKFGQPPANATDGTFYAGSTQVNGVRAPSEGKHSVYAWLRDGAGNGDSKTAVAISDTVWYDGTPPRSVITPTAASGVNGWYIEPVTFDVSATDAASGLLEIHYQINDGPVQAMTGDQMPLETMSAAGRFVVSDEGRHTVRVWAVDRAGNVEPAQIYEVRIDRIGPTARLTGPTDLVTQTMFDVSWTGADSPDGSGLVSYDVQVRDGLAGAWQNWLSDTRLTAARFQGQRSHQYVFRVYGRDAAGNRQDAPGTLKVLIQPVLNGTFDTGVFSDWTVGGPLVASVVATTGPGNVSTLAAKLGSDTLYGPSIEKPGNVPAGCAVMSQPITVPGPDQVQRPRLLLWYRILTYDVLYSKRLQDYGDFLDVKLMDGEGNLVARLLRAGNPTDMFGQLYDTGWQLGTFDLRAYAGWSGVLTIANCNGPEKAPDNLFNTWSYVDNVQIVEDHALYLPLVSQETSTGAAAGETTAPLPGAAHLDSESGSAPAVDGAPLTAGGDTHDAR